MPAAYWTIIGTMAQAVPFPLNWMLEPQYLLGLLTQANAKAIIALGPSPGFNIWESIMSIKDRLPEGLPIWSVTVPGTEVLREFDLDLQLLGHTEAGLGFVCAATARKGTHIPAYVHPRRTPG